MTAEEQQRIRLQAVRSGQHRRAKREIRERLALIESERQVLIGHLRVLEKEDPEPYGTEPITKR